MASVEGTWASNSEVHVPYRAHRRSAQPINTHHRLAEGKTVAEIECQL